MTPVVEGTGDGYPGDRAGNSSRKENVAIQAGDAFRASDAWQTSQNRMDPGGPYAVKDAAHPHDRIEERTPLHRSHVELLQGAVDMLGLPKAKFHLPLRNKDGSTMGYAQFRGVENRDRPVLVTILGPQMKPGGEDISRMLYKSSEALATNVARRQNALFETDQRDPQPPESIADAGPHERSGRQETASYAVRKAFDRADHGGSDVIENKGLT